jgi:glycerol-3-phosphate dehydrogenase
LGTWESARSAEPDDTTAVRSEIDIFLSDVRAAFPAMDLKRDEVTLVHCGVVPAVRKPDGSVGLAGHEHVQENLHGLLSIAGTKYTTARATAQRVVDRVFALLGREAPSCRTAVEPLPGIEVFPVSPEGQRHRFLRAVRDEMALTLCDVVLRRTPLGATGYPGDAAVERAADVVGSEMAWQPDQRRAEIDAVKAFYGTVNALKT